MPRRENRSCTSGSLNCDYPRSDMNVDVVRDFERLLGVDVEHLAGVVRVFRKGIRVLIALAKGYQTELCLR